MSRRLLIAVCAAMAALSAPRASLAEIIWAMTNSAFSPQLFSFDSAAPATPLTTPTTITGLVAGHAWCGIDFRPSNGLLYGVSSNTSSAGQLYTIDLATAVATPVGSGFALVSGSIRASADWNPVDDVLRVVTGDGKNVTVNGAGALVSTDGNLAYAAGDPNAGILFPFIVGIAHSNNVAGAGTTTLYGHDADPLTDVLTTIVPNTGVMTTVGTMVIGVGGDVGFDISGPTGIAYSQLNDLGTVGIDELFSINLNTGAATLLGGFNLDILDISAPVPEPSSLATLGLASLALLARRRGAGAQG